MLRLTMLLAAQLFAWGLFAQVSSPEKQNAWAFTFSLGSVYGPASSQIESAMRIAGLNHQGSTSLFGNDGQPVNYPHSQAEISWSVSAGRVINPLISTVILLDFVNYGSTVGKGEVGQVLRISTKTTNLSPLFNYSLNDWLAVGAGPSFIFMTRQKNFVKESPRALILGGVLSSTLKTPRHSHLFAFLNIQYRWMQRQNVGPYIAKLGSNIAYFPKTSISFNQLYFNLGIGVRFFQKK
jgi:hypothetical protein